MIRVQLLGGASLRAGDTPVAGPPAQRHRIALLSLIVAAWPQPLSRDRAMALLWPERELAKARRLLNLAVHVLRSALGEDAILSAGDGLVLNPAVLTCALHELRDAMAAGDAERIARCYTGALLDGFHLAESSEFEFWLDERRNELAHAYSGALRAVAADQERTGDVHGRVRTCRRLVIARPHSGMYARALMRALDAAGDRAGAIRHAEEHARRLATDLDLPPDPEVAALAEELRAAAPVRRPPESSAAPDARRRSGQAWQLYLQGRRWIQDYTVPALARAANAFDRAAAHDPEFALALAGLAKASIELAQQGGLEPEVAFARAADAANRAIELDPDCADAHCAMGYLKAARDFDWSGAEREFRHALELDPDDADSLDLYGRVCAALGRYDEAIGLQRRAQELDPLAHRLDAVSTLLRAGRHGEAVVGAQDAVELDPTHERSRATLGWAYLLSGRKEEGLAELERAVALAPGSTLWLAQLGQAYAMAGQSAKAHEILEELETRAESGYVPPYHLAYVYTGLGDGDGAVEWLERAVAERSGAVYGIKGSFLFAGLRGHAGFQALLRRMNLE